MQLWLIIGTIIFTICIWAQLVLVIESWNYSTNRGKYWKLFRLTIVGLIWIVLITLTMEQTFFVQ